MVFCYGTTLRLDLPFFNDDHPSFLCSSLPAHSLPLLGPNCLCFLFLGFFSLKPFLQPLRLSAQLPSGSPRWLEFLRLKDYSAQPHHQAISIFNLTSSGQYSSG